MGLNIRPMTKRVKQFHALASDRGAVREKIMMKSCCVRKMGSLQRRTGYGRQMAGTRQAIELQTRSVTSKRNKFW